MDINELTIGQAKELQGLFGSSQQSKPHPWIGKYVIIRTNSAGVHAGTLAAKDGKEVELKDSRRLWRFWCKQGISLSSVALHGIKHDKSRIAGVLPELWLEAIEIIPCSKEAQESLEGAPVSEQS